MAPAQRNVLNLAVPSRRFNVSREKGSPARYDRCQKAPRGGQGHESTRYGRGRAGSVLNIFQAAIHFSILFDQAAGDEILKFLVGAETEHFLPAADGISGLQVLIDDLKKVVKPEGLFVRKYGDQFISYMIWNPSRESCSTCG